MLPSSDREYRLLRAACCDSKCQALLTFTSFENVVDCLHCGQQHEKDSLQDLRVVQGHEVASCIETYVRRVLITNTSPKRGTEMVKVLGLSNYYCKLLSPLLTKYGMDKVTGRAKLLTDMNQGEIFDCSLFGDRAFSIEDKHISIPGFGRDITGSMDYLSETLKLIVACNDGEERLIPIHADGDGHCLVHAISRALVGRELFWHPLRCCLKRHFENNLPQYKELFKDFIDTVEWPSIIDECDPDFQPPEGELHGLRNIHIFGLANVLRRPIILLDSLECMQKCGDYSALFLPGFVSPDACRGKDNSLNKPLCIAWSSHSHNHYIPLVGVQKLPLPVLPSNLIPKVWGMPQSQILMYMEFDSNSNCTIGGGRVLSEAYIQRLVGAMEMLFYEQNGVHPSIVTDTKLFLCPSNALFPTKPAVVIQKAKLAVEEGRLYRCLFCKALCELRIEKNWFTNGGVLYKTVLQIHKTLNSNTLYEFPLHGISCLYDPVKDELVPDMNRMGWDCCTWCKSPALRKIKADGTVILIPEDKTSSEDTIFTNSQSDEIDQYENCTDQKVMEPDEPRKIIVKLQWKEQVIEEHITWSDFCQVSGDGIVQSVPDIASNLIAKHFPGETSNTKLKALVTEEIWKQLGRPAKVKDAFLPSESVVIDMIENQSSVKEVKEMQMLAADINESKLSASEPQYVKVVTSDGQQANIILNNEGISYVQLQEWIKSQFNISIPSQRIKYGFPPKELSASCDSSNQTLPLKHGDRLTVEILKDTPMRPAPYRKNVIKEYIPQTSFEQLCPSDILWNLVKLSPENFKNKGFVYAKIAEKHVLSESLHVRLEEYPNKVLCYNPTKDRIEVCSKPLGHFEINSEIGHKIERARKGEYVPGVSRCPLISGNKQQLQSSVRSTKLASGSSTDSKTTSLIRKGPGFSILTSPESSENMDLS